MPENDRTLSTTRLPLDGWCRLPAISKPALFPSTTECVTTVRCDAGARAIASPVTWYTKLSVISVSRPFATTIPFDCTLWLVTRVHWWIESRSLLLKNETPGGNWLQVRVEGKNGVNRMGIGSRVSIYPAGKLGQAADLLGMREIAIGYGYCSGQEAIAHFGLGQTAAVDVEVVLPHGKGKIVQRNVKGNQRIVVAQ